MKIQNFRASLWSFFLVSLKFDRFSKTKIRQFFSNIYVSFFPTKDSCGSYVSFFLKYVSFGGIRQFFFWLRQKILITSEKNQPSKTTSEIFHHWPIRVVSPVSIHISKAFACLIQAMHSASPQTKRKYLQRLCPVMFPAGTRRWIEEKFSGISRFMTSPAPRDLGWHAFPKIAVRQWGHLAAGSDIDSNAAVQWKCVRRPFDGISGCGSS